MVSNYLVTLAVEDELALRALEVRLLQNGETVVAFYEPDIEGLTAICIAPSASAAKYVSSLPLALKKSGAIDKHHCFTNSLTDG